MASLAPSAPPLPPEIRDQQGGQPGGGQPPIMSQVGQSMNQGQPGGGGDMIAQLEAKAGELDRWAQDMMMMIEQVHKPLGALMVPIAKAGIALKQEISKLKQPKMSGSAAPGGPPPGGGQGGPPPPNPAEGAMTRQAA